MPNQIKLLANRAHHLVNEAIWKGFLVRTACERCGSDKQTSHGHHEDYAKPLDVVWLCPRCHKALHNARRRGATESSLPSIVEALNFCQHMALAQAWLRATERRGTDQQAFALMRQKTGTELLAMCQQAQVPLPLGCSPQETCSC